MKRIAKIQTEEQLVASFEKLFHIMVNLRAFTIEYENNNRFGVMARQKKAYWEDKADQLIEDLQKDISPDAQNG